MKAMDKEEHLVLTVVLLLLTLCCLGFSFWFMTLGYRSLVGNILGSAALSFILVLMLFGLNYRLRRGLMQGISGVQILMLLGVYLLVVFASFSGLFNKFYSTFMHTELIKEETTKKIAALQTLKASAIAELSSEEAEKVRVNVKGLIQQFKLQVISPAEPGWGKKAEAIMKQIEGLLDTKITRMPPKNGSTGALKELGALYENMILNQ